MSVKRQWRAAALLAAALVLPGAVRAQGPEFETTDEPAAPEVTARKTTSFFRRAATGTPAAQLDHARTLAADGRTRKAGKAYDALVRTWHDTPEAVTAQRALAGLLEEDGCHERAFKEFQYLVDFYAGRFNYRDVLDHQFRLAQAVMTRRRSRWLFGGFTAPERALPLLKQLALNAPSWERAAEVQMTIGLIHEEEGDLDDAVSALETVQQRWPASPGASTASFARSRALARVARRNPRDEPGVRRALSALAGFIRDYPDDPNVPEAAAARDDLNRHLTGMYYERAAYYDRIARRPQAALIAYADFLRRFPLSEQAVQVNRRMEELKAMEADDERARGEQDREDAGAPRQGTGIRYENGND